MRNTHLVFISGSWLPNPWVTGVPPASVVIIFGHPPSFWKGFGTFPVYGRDRGIFCYSLQAHSAVLEFMRWPVAGRSWIISGGGPVARGASHGISQSHPHFLGLGFGIGSIANGQWFKLPSLCHRTSTKHWSRGFGELLGCWRHPHAGMVAPATLHMPRSSCALWILPDPPRVPIHLAVHSCLW